MSFVLVLKTRAVCTSGKEIEVPGLSGVASCVENVGSLFGTDLAEQSIPLVGCTVTAKWTIRSSCDTAFFRHGGIYRPMWSQNQTIKNLTASAASRGSAPETQSTKATEGARLSHGPR